MIEIIPITYLIFLSIILTPIFILLVLQVINFQRKEFNLLKMLQSISSFNLSPEEIYSIAHICIDHKKLSLALTILEDEMHGSIEIDVNWQAKYYNAIGFTFNKIQFNMIAKEYYKYALQLDPAYLYPSHNLRNLSRQ